MSTTQGLLYTVVGNPIAHSLSPYIQTLFAKSTSLDLEYHRTLSPLTGFKACVEELADKGYQGANITRPFKFEALQMASYFTARAQLAQAANTLRFDGGLGARGWWADNTDGIGLVRDITQNATVTITHKKVLLIGAGGAAAGVLGALLEANPAELVVANRTLERAQNLVKQHSAVADQYAVKLFAKSLQDCGQGFDVVINSTASSQEGSSIPVSANVLKTGTLALDMTYGAAALPFMQWAQAHSAMGRDGLGMLVEQGAESFFFWHGIRPTTADVLQQTRLKLST